MSEESPIEEEYESLLAEAAARVEKLRTELLFDEAFDGSETLCPIATQHWLAALAQLELARLELEKAKLWEATALGAGQGRR